MGLRNKSEHGCSHCWRARFDPALEWQNLRYLCFLFSGCCKFWLNAGTVYLFFFFPVFLKGTKVQPEQKSSSCSNWKYVVMVTLSPPWCRLKTTNKSAKSEILMPFGFLFPISTWKDFHQNAQYFFFYSTKKYAVCRHICANFTGWGSEGVKKTDVSMASAG